MRPDGLACLEGVALCLVDLLQRDEHLREPALALAERAAVLERLQDPDRVAEAALGGGQIAPATLDPAEVVVDARERPLVPGLGEELFRLREPRSGLVQPATQRSIRACETSAQPRR